MSEKTTSDIYLAAAFLASGAKLEKTDRTDPRHMEFTFSANGSYNLVGVKTASDSANISAPVPPASGAIVLTQPLDLEAIETQWVNKQLKGNLFEFAEAIKRMKSVVHSR